MATQPSPHDLHLEGWSLIPVRSNKKPMLATWKSYQEQRATEEQLNEWISWKPAIWGAPTGPISDRFSCDFDGEKGRNTLERMELVPHRSTPNGGFHSDIELPEWRVLTLSGKTKQALGIAYPGLDIRGTGGYINVLGGTDTGQYQWLVEDRTPHSIDLLPEELLHLIGMPSTESEPQTISHLDERPDGNDMDGLTHLAQLALDQVEQGAGRNDTGFWLACQLRDNQFSRVDAELCMQEFVEMVPLTNTKGVPEPYTWTEARSSLNQAWSRAPRDPWPCSISSLSETAIKVNDRQLVDISDEAKRAIVDANDPPVLFRRGGALVRVSEDETGRTHAEPVTPDILRNRLAQVEDWYSGGLEDAKHPPKNAYPPMDVVRNLIAEEWSQLPVLTDIIEAPTLREDGTVLADNGYDEQSKLWLTIPSTLDFPGVPDQPTDFEVDAAVSLIWDMLSEFAFADAASAANAFGFILTSVLRSAIPGLIPMALIDAPIAGSGKTHLVNVAAMIATGRSAALSSAPNGNDEELRKRITASLLAGDAMIVFDNLSGVLKSPILAQAVTSSIWSDRLLGVSKNVKLDQRAVWVTTGNNVILGGDIPNGDRPPRSLYE